MSKLKHSAQTTIEYLFYALFFFVPLILWPKTSEVFEFNKILFVYALTTIIAAAWVTKWITDKKITIRRTPLDLPIALYLLSQILSTIFSIDTHTSLWGYYSRFHGGLVSTIAYIVLYYALVTNFTREKVIFLIYSILGSAILVSLYGVLEHFGIDAHLWVQDVRNRVFSTLGQPNWLSAYLVAILPIPIFLALKSRGRTSSLLYIALAALFTITIWFTKSQSGLSATLLILAAIPAYLLGRKYKVTYLIAGIVLLAVVALKWNFVQKISPFGPPNLQQLVEQDAKNRIGGSDSMLIRQVVWQGARELASQYPLFGTGVETFGYSYYTVRPALHNLLSEWEFLYNKAHNEFLNTLANTGYFGLASYLLLIGWTITVWLKQKEDSPISDALLLGYVSILITNYFGFSVVPVALFFFLFPALNFISSNTKEEYRTIKFPINGYLGILLMLLASYFMLLTPYRQFRADLAYNRARLYLAGNSYKASLEDAKKAISLSPNEPLFHATLAESSAAAAAAVKSQLESLPASLSAQLKSEADTLTTGFITDALANSQKAIELNPNHANLWKSKAKAQLYLGTIDDKYNRLALETLIDLTQIAPTDPKILLNIGLLYKQFGEEEKSQRAFEKALELKPDYVAAKELLR